jgi:MYXO-CTERM domain-containing protein
MGIEPRRSPGTLRRLVVASGLAVFATGVALAPVAAAEGPGYGATADELSVSWDASPAPQAAGPGDVAPSGPRLRLQGVGFRGGSSTEVRFGDGGTRTIAADDTGTVQASVVAATVTSAPGTSVVALGVTPSGSRRVLVGSVPPQPSGRGPADVVPVVAGAGAVLMAGSALRRRRRH